MTVRLEGKLTNSEGEFIASGPCEVNRERGEVTMWPSWEMHMLERERGPLALELEDGATLDISDKHLTFKLAGPADHRISVYRLRIVERVPQHMTTGYAEPSTRDDQPATPSPAIDTDQAPLEAQRGGA